MIQTAFRTKLPSKALLFFAFTLLLFSCKEQAQQTQQPPLVVDFIQLGATNAEVEKKYPGTIEGTVNVDIKAQVTGYLEQIYVKEGDYVKKGDLIGYVGNTGNARHTAPHLHYGIYLDGKGRGVVNPYPYLR